MSLIKLTRTNGHDSSMIILKPHVLTLLLLNSSRDNTKKSILQQQEERERDQKPIMDGHRMNFAAEDIRQKTANDKKILEMHLKVLDDLVNVNSLFTTAVFISLSLANPNPTSLENRQECDPDRGMAKTLIMYEVLSFSVFLVSSLAAKSLKVLLNIFKLREDFEIELPVIFGSPSLRNFFFSKLWRRIIWLISTGASALGVLFLMLSMVIVIQLRLGKLSCGSSYTLRSVISLIVLVVFSLMLYLPPMIFASMTNFKISSAPRSNGVIESESI